MIKAFETCRDGSFDDILDMMSCGSLESLTSYDEFLFWETFGQEIHREVRDLFNNEDELFRIMTELSIVFSSQVTTITSSVLNDNAL